MTRAKKTKGLYIVGVIYRYISPSGKSYIGQTTNEAHRRCTWFCTRYRYAGAAINRARAKYGPENFDYQVLFKRVFSSFEEARQILDEQEIYYIKQYDSLKNGYNNTVGGLVPEIVFQTQSKGKVASRKKGVLSKAQLKKYSPKHTKEEIQLLRKETNRRNGRWRKIIQFDASGNFIKEFSSASEAQEKGFGYATNIKRACKTLGMYKGYNWRFSSDGTVMKVKEQKEKSKEQYKKLWKPVNQYTKEGIFVSSYSSIKEAAAAIGKHYTSGISGCLLGKEKAAHGYVWEYNM